MKLRTHSFNQNFMVTMQKTVKIGGPRFLIKPQGNTLQFSVSQCTHLIVHAIPRKKRYVHIHVIAYNLFADLEINWYVKSKKEETKSILETFGILAYFALSTS
jgi:hypothetical protein